MTATTLLFAPYSPTQEDAKKKVENTPKIEDVDVASYDIVFFAGTLRSSLSYAETLRPGRVVSLLPAPLTVISFTGTGGHGFCFDGANNGVVAKAIMAAW